MNGLEKEVVGAEELETPIRGSRFCASPKLARDNSPWVGYGSKTKLRPRSGMQCLPPNRHSITRHLTPRQYLYLSQISFAVEVAQFQMTILRVGLSDTIACSAPLW
jgi:hypothetical protein